MNEAAGELCEAFDPWIPPEPVPGPANDAVGAVPRWVLLLWTAAVGESGALRRTYTLTTADMLVPPQTQKVMAASVGADVVEIAADHGLFREQPARVAGLLIAAGS